MSGYRFDDYGPDMGDPRDDVSVEEVAGREVVEDAMRDEIEAHAATVAALEERVKALEFLVWAASEHVEYSSLPDCDELYDAMNADMAANESAYQAIADRVRAAALTPTEEAEGGGRDA